MTKIGVALLWPIMAALILGGRLYNQRTSAVVRMILALFALFWMMTTIILCGFGIIKLTAIMIAYAIAASGVFYICRHVTA